MKAKKSLNIKKGCDLRRNFSFSKAVKSSPFALKKSNNRIKLLFITKMFENSGKKEKSCAVTARRSLNRILKKIHRNSLLCSRSKEFLCDLNWKTQGTRKISAKWRQGKKVDCLPWARHTREHVFDRGQNLNPEFLTSASHDTHGMMTSARDPLNYLIWYHHKKCFMYFGFFFRNFSAVNEIF